MRASQTARLDALGRIQTFLDQHADVVGTINKSTSRTTLDQAVQALRQTAANQAAAEQEMTARTKLKDTLREELRLHHIQPIVAIAKKKFAKTDLIADFKLPAKNTGDSALIAAGTMMADKAAQYSPTFIDQQLPADFIAQLRAAVDALQQAVNARAFTQSQLTTATQTVLNELAIAHTDVQVLNALVVKQLKGNTDLLAGWKQTKRVKAKTSVSGVAVVPSTPLPVTTPAPVATPVAPATPVVTPVAKPAVVMPVVATVPSTAPAEVPVTKAA